MNETLTFVSLSKELKEQYEDFKRMTFFAEAFDMELQHRINMETFCYSNLDFVRIFYEHVSSLIQKEEKVIGVLTYKETMFKIGKLIKENFHAEFPVLMISFGMNDDQRTHIINEFKDLKQGALLLSTNILTRGMTFPYCHHLFNLDVPNSVVTLLQRNNRIRKLGINNGEKHIHYLVTKDTIHEEKYWTLQNQLSDLK